MELQTTLANAGQAGPAGCKFSSFLIRLTIIIHWLFFNFFFHSNRCDEDINECDPDPCQNNATCENLIGRYFCTCTEDFVGVDCERPRIVTCANDPCLNGANCSDIFDPVTELAINYTCSCPFGYEGINCHLEIDFCQQLLDPCRNGATCSRVSFEPVSSFFSLILLQDNLILNDLLIGRDMYASVPKDIAETSARLT